MYRLARKRRLLYSVVKKSPVCRATLSGSEVTSSLQLVTSYPQCVTSSFQHVRGLHSTPPSLNLIERIAGVGSFRYDVILPDNDSKPEVNCYLLYLITFIKVGMYLKRPKTFYLVSSSLLIQVLLLLEFLKNLSLYIILYIKYYFS